MPFASEYWQAWNMPDSTALRSGRPIGRPKKAFPRDRIPELLAEGLSPRQIAPGWT